MFKVKCSPANHLPACGWKNTRLSSNENYLVIEVEKQPASNEFKIKIQSEEDYLLRRKIDFVYTFTNYELTHFKFEASRFTGKQFNQFLDKIKK